MSFSHRPQRRLTTAVLILVCALLSVALLTMCFVGVAHAEGATNDAPTAVPTAVISCKCEVIPGDEPLPPTLIYAAVLTSSLPLTSPPDVGQIVADDGELLVFTIIDVNLDNVVDQTDLVANDPISNVSVFVGLGQITPTVSVTQSLVMVSSSIGQITLPKHDGYYFLKVFDNHTQNQWDLILKTPEFGNVRVEHIPYQKPTVLMPMIATKTESSGEGPPLFE